MNYEQMSMLEVAVDLLGKETGPVEITKILDGVLAAKNINDEDGTIRAQLYADITTSSKFVYMGNNTWDLKLRQSLDEYDKDGSAWNEGIIEEDDDDETTVSDYNLDDDDEKTADDDDEDTEKSEDDEEESDKAEDAEAENYEMEPSTDDDDDEDESEFDDVRDNPDEENDFNEDDYEGYMDDYEDLYDKK